GPVALLGRPGHLVPGARDGRGPGRDRRGRRRVHSIVGGGGDRGRQRDRHQHHRGAARARPGARLGRDRLVAVTAGSRRPRRRGRRRRGATVVGRRVTSGRGGHRGTGGGRHFRRRRRRQRWPSQILRTVGRNPVVMPFVLMYHSVAEETDDPYAITVSPARFERQLRWLRRRGL